MKIINKFLIAFATVAFLSGGVTHLMAQTTTGVVGYETRHATVNFSDMVAYDAAHPELQLLLYYQLHQPLPVRYIGMP